MAANKKNFEFSQGSTFRLLLTIRSAGVPIDLTGYTFRGKVKESIADSAALISFSFTLRDQTSYPGQVYAELTAVNTAGLTVPATTDFTQSRFMYDIEAVDTDAYVHAIMYGFLDVRPEVTN